MRCSVVLMGGIGNQLFQIACLLAYSMKYEIDYCLPLIVKNPHNANPRAFYSQYINYCQVPMISTATVFAERSFRYNPLPPPFSDFTMLTGYFQSYRHFEKYNEEVLEILDIPEIPHSHGAIFLHYRLGDYRKLKHYHQIISRSYIVNAVSYFVEKGFSKFIVCSDEIISARKKIESIFQSDKLEFIYSTGRNEVEELSLMASCDGGIMSASSFSFWGAWLGNAVGRDIIYPAQWFAPSVAHSIEDLCPNSWRAI